MDSTMQQTQRKRYMDNEISHDEYYLWLADYCNLGTWVIPAYVITGDKLQAPTDPHFNDIPLAIWDRAARQLPIASKGPVALSLSDRVCMLKALARKLVGKAPIGKREE